MSRIRVLVVDDHALFRGGVRWALGGHPEITVVGEAGDGPAALQLAEALLPDVVLCDLSLPGMSGLELTRLLARRLPATAVIALTVHRDPSVRASAHQAGAAAYLTKEDAGPELPGLIARVARGERPLPLRRPTAPAPAVSPRELEVLALVARGRSNKEIARLLAISQQTVKNHVTTALRKLGAADRAEAATYALRRGWIALDDDLLAGAGELPTAPPTALTGATR